MKWLNGRSLLISAVLFIAPIFCYPVRGALSNNITTYTYGFPFSWISVHFSARGGRVFFWQAITSQDQGISIDFITAILNFIILYIVVRAVINVFSQKKKKRDDKKTKS